MANIHIDNKMPCQGAYAHEITICQSILICYIKKMWRSPPLRPAITAGQAHVWRVALEQPVDVVMQLTKLLSKDERERAGRFHFERDKRRFLVRHGALRKVLGFYLEEAPEALRFQYGPWGKPFLAPKPAGKNIRFNMSHSHDAALIAFADSREVGVDIERLRECTEKQIGRINMISDYFFSPAENRLLRPLAGEEKLKMLLTFWTRKEAAVKARGLGIAAFDPDMILSSDSRRSVRDIRPYPGYTGALCLQGPLDSNNPLKNEDELICLFDYLF